MLILVNLVQIFSVQWNVDSSYEYHFGGAQSDLGRRNGDTASARTKLSPNGSTSSVKFTEPHVSYYSWGDEGVNLKQVVKQINTSYYEIKKIKGLSEKPFPAFIFVHENKPTMYVSVAILMKLKLKWRIQMLLEKFQMALQVELYQNRYQFTALVDALTQVGSLPLLFDLSDYRGCPNNPSGHKLANVSDHTFDAKDGVVPLFTLCQSPSCKYAFPIPTYSTYNYAESMAGDGNNSKSDTLHNRIEEWAQTYPWHKKIAKVYWRGRCRLGTGLHRYRFVSKALNITRKETEQISYLAVSPIGPCRSLIGNPEKSSVEESMKYKAVFDIDGNSWSERFPRLLCYNSAVVRIDIGDENNEMEEYLMAELVPGVHFIPANLRNFTQVASMIMQEENDAMLQNIVKNANQWCQEHMTVEQLNLDFLSVLNGYVDSLNKHGNSTWGQEWLQVSNGIVGSQLFQEVHGGFVSSLSPNRKRRTKPERKFLDTGETWKFPINRTF